MTNSVLAADRLSAEILEQTFVDPLGLEQFWVRQYLDGFVDLGHGKVKLMVGKPGSGKTHFLYHFGVMAQSLGYAVVQIDGAVERLGAIDDLYRAVAGQVAWDQYFEAALSRVIHDELGYPEFEASPVEFLRWGETVRNLLPNLLRRDVREAIDRFLGSMDLDGEFLMAIRVHLNQMIAGQAPEGVAHDWLLGQKVGASQRRSVGLRASVSKRNARALLTSLAAFVHQLSDRGLVVLIDNVGVFGLTTRVDGRPYYTRAARDQSYEMLRELIDESAFSPYLLVVLAGDGEIVAGEKTGFASYPALWARLHSEVQSTRPNLFGDTVDLDQLWAQDGARLEGLVERWRHVVLTEDVYGSMSAEVATLGLEWGQPRRLVSDMLNRQRQRGEAVSHE